MDELKDYLKCKFVFITEIHKNISLEDFDITIFENNAIKNINESKLLNTFSNTGKILIFENNEELNTNYDFKLKKPFSIIELKEKIYNLITVKKFNKNSSIKIKEYLLDKNEKKFKKDNLYIIVTEKEIKLIELLFFQKESMTKKEILKKVWNYSSEADTHTVETHIYRLRKKIADKFNDLNLITNTKKGYSI